MTNDPARAVRDVLDEFGIRYERHDHPPVFTVEEAVVHWRDIDATHCKNLFLRNKKGNRHYLVVAEHTRPVDLQRLVTLIGDDRLSFASPDRLMRYLGLEPGSVSPFGLINDPDRHVQVVVDSGLKQCRRVGFHPNVNTSTLVVAFEDFERFLTRSGHVVRYVAL